MSSSEPTYIGIIVPAFGEEYLKKAGKALESVARLKRHHGLAVVGYTASNATDLFDARNSAADMALDEGADWLIFLDADDTLDENYLLAASELFDEADLIKPATLGVYEDGSTDDEVVMIPAPKNPLDKNDIVIGAPIRSSLFVEVGGFNDLPVLEDWELWLRCREAGARIVECPGAIYRVGVNPGGRNQTGEGSNAKQHHAVYRQIRSRSWNFPS